MTKKVKIRLEGELKSFTDSIERELIEIGLALHVNPQTLKLEAAYLLPNGNFELAIDVLYALLHAIQDEIKDSKIRTDCIDILNQFIEFLGSKDTTEFVVTH